MLTSKKPPELSTEYLTEARLNVQIFGRTKTELNIINMQHFLSKVSIENVVLFSSFYIIIRL